MGAVGRKLRKLEGGHIAFYCPGCKEPHIILIGRWSWNGSGDAPTFHPSVSVKNGHYSDLHKAGEDCWCTYNKEHPEAPSTFKCGICHSFVRDGQIEFLGDCTHELAGKTVQLPDYP